MADLLAGKGELEAAIEHFSRALEQKPGMRSARLALANAHSAQGAALAARGEIDGAIAQFKAAVDLAPDDPSKHSNLGLALATAGAVPEATRAYERALELDPTYQPARLQLRKLRERRLLKEEPGGETTE
jgi:tetratricopeptide (TPR) repeat protein